LPELHISPYCKVSIIFDDIEGGLLDYKDAPTDKGKLVFEKLLQSREFILDLEGL